MVEQASKPPDRELIFDMPRLKVLRDEVVLAIEKAILLGSVAPGQRLVESEIAKKMGISKAPVREALRRLEQLGLVVNHPRRGTFVTQITATMASEAFSLRLLLETYAARLAVHSLDEQHFRRLDELMEQADLVAAVDPGQLVDLDLAYHDLLFEVGGHRLLQEAWANLRAQIRLLLAASGVLTAIHGRTGRRLTMVDAHEPITSALRARQIDRVEAALLVHLAEGERRLLVKLSGGQSQPYVRSEMFALSPKPPSPITAGGSHGLVSGRGADPEQGGHGDVKR